MGAQDISLNIDFKASRADIDKAFEKRRSRDRSENGSREGYSGDFQTVNSVKYHTDKVFTSYNEAYDYCMNHAEKWVNVIAVYYVDSKVESSKLTKLNETVLKLSYALRALKDTELSRKSAFKTCENCSSRVSLLHFRGYVCPVCNVDLRPNSLINRIKSMQSKRDALKLVVDELIKIERTKLIKNDKNIKTLVAGWGAS